MKYLISILLSAFIFSNINAQILADSAIYFKGLKMVELSKTVSDYKNAGDYFNEISSKKHTDWLSPLYAGLSYILASFNEKDSKIKDELCDKAQIFIDTAMVRHADISECSALQAFLYQAKIDVSPMERGLEYSLKADAEIKKAEAANPNDPRPYFLYAMNVHYTPKIFDGGPARALPLFEKAAVKFDVFVPKMPFMPHWGKQQNLDMIAKCKKEVDTR